MTEKPAAEKTRRTERVIVTETHEPLVGDATFGRVVKSALDLGVPGFSRYMAGEFGDGLLHTMAGIAAAVAFGPVGFWLVGANSISKSASGRNLWERGSVRKVVEYEMGE